MRRTIDETPKEWCLRTLKVIDDERGPICRWNVEGRSNGHDNYASCETLCRTDAYPSSHDELCRDLERAMDNGGYRQYRVTAWTAGARRQFSTKTWPNLELDDQAEAEAGLGGSGPKDIIAQVLRHKEVMFRMTMGSLSDVFGHVRDENHELRDEVQNLRKRELDVFAVLQDLLDRGGERETTLARENSLTKGIDTLISVAQAKFLGGPQPGEQGAALASALANFGETIDEQQANALQQIFRPEQIIALNKLMDPDEQKKAEAEAEAEGQKALPPSSPPTTPPPAPPEALPTAITPAQLRAWKTNMPAEDFKALLLLLKDAQSSSPAEPTPTPTPTPAPSSQPSADVDELQDVADADELGDVIVVDSRPTPAPEPVRDPSDKS